MVFFWSMVLVNKVLIVIVLNFQMLLLLINKLVFNVKINFIYLMIIIVFKSKILTIVLNTITLKIKVVCNVKDYFLTFNLLTNAKLSMKFPIALLTTKLILILNVLNVPMDIFLIPLITNVKTYQLVTLHVNKLIMLKQIVLNVNHLKYYEMESVLITCLTTQSTVIKLTMIKFFKMLIVKFVKKIHFLISSLQSPHV